MERTRTNSRILSNLALGAVFAALGAVAPASQVDGQVPPGAASGNPGSAPAAPAPKPLTPPPAAPTALELAGPPATATRLPSGVATRQLRAGTGKVQPRLQDFVLFFAIGRKSDGTVVQNTYSVAEPARMPMTKLYPAWREAFAGMVAGEQRRFWFPANLAPKNPQTGAQEALVFDLELVHVIRVPDTPAALKNADPKASQVGLGTRVLSVKAGKGGAKATRLDAALLNFTVWNEAGEVLSSSAVDGRPTLFPLDRVMTSFADCVEGMTVGELRRCWIPAARNEGFPSAPTGALIFELELLNLADAAKIFTPGAANPN